MQDARKVIHVLHEIIVLGAGARDTDRIAFLEGIVADQVRRHLPCEADHGDRVHQGIGEARHRIGGAGAGGDEHHAALAGGARIAFRRMGGTLLMADEDVLHLLLLENLVIDRKHGAARIPEDMLDPLVSQCLQHDFSACHLVRGHFKPLEYVSFRQTRILHSGNKKGPRGSLISAQHHQFLEALSLPGVARSYYENDSHD